MYYDIRINAIIKMQFKLLNVMLDENTQPRKLNTLGI